MPAVFQVTADLTDRDALAAALADVKPAHTFVTAWMRMESEAENVRVNGGIVRDLGAVPNLATVKHLAV